MKKNITLILLLMSLPVWAEDNSAIQLYAQYCAVCHGVDRLGGTGPPLLPENLKRVNQKQAFDIIKTGRAATQMPGFEKSFTDDQIEALIDLIYTPLAAMPLWDKQQIQASRIQHPIKSKSNTPRYRADPLNLFLVVETGDHHVTVLDGDRMQPIHRFKSRHALHGGPKYTSDGRYVFFASRDGWVSKFDMHSLETIVEVRVGINTRNIAVSSDGRYVIAGNYLPHTLVILNAVDLSLEKIIPVRNSSGQSSRVSAVYDARPRKSFIVALKDLPEVWEIPYDENAEPVYPGLVHDYRYQEAIPLAGPFPVRRIRLNDYLDDFFFDEDYQHLIGAARNGKNGQVVNLIAGRKIADIDLPGMPHLGSGIIWEYQGRKVMATPNLKKGEVTVIDMKTWKVIKRIQTLGPGFFMRSHENTEFAWVDVFFGPNNDVMHVINKNTLEIEKTLRPEPGKTSAHIEFTRDGKYALLSLWEIDGAVIVYDANELREIKRLPMKKPSGKYNVYNKITLSAGTSH